MTDQIRGFLELLGNELVEVRTFNPPRNLYFDDPVAAAAAAKTLDQSGDYNGVFVTLNRIHSDLAIGRRNLPTGRSCGFGTKDADIEHYSVLFIDIDPKRESGNPANETERLAARRVAEDVRVVAMDSGFPEPAHIDSGNGRYLLWRLDLPAGDKAHKALVKATLQAFAAHCNTESATVDCSVHNPSRVMRIVGTMNRKGTEDGERQHRRCQVVSLPPSGRLELVDRETLTAFACQPVGIADNFDFGPTAQSEAEELETLIDNVRRYLVHHGITDLTVQRQPEFTKLYSKTCRFKDECVPGDGNFGVLVWNDKTVGVKCFHAKCEGKSWKDLQKLFCQDFEEFLGQPKSRVIDGIVREVTDPLLLAESHIDATRHVSGHRTLVMIDGSLRRYDEAHGWSIVDRGQFSAEVWDTVQARFDQDCRESQSRGIKASGEKVNHSRVRNTIHAIESRCLTTTKSDPYNPFWLAAHEWNATDMLVFQNGILNVQMYLQGEVGSFVPPTPQLYTANCAKLDFDPDAVESPRFHAFLDSLKLSKEELLYLQQLFGYAIWHRKNLQKMVMLAGPPRCGKGTLLGVLTDLVGGDRSVCSLNPNDVAHEFGLEQTLGKRIISIPEMCQPKNPAVVASRLKAITGGDAISVNRKNKPMISSKILGTIIFQTNEFVALPDNSGALNARLLPFQLAESYAGCPDIHLAENLKDEYSAILCWALEGVRALESNGFTFAVAGRSLELLRQLQRASSPVGEFISEYCVLDRGYAVQYEAMHEAYEQYRNDQCPECPGYSKGKLAKEIAAAAAAVILGSRLSSTNCESHDGMVVVQTARMSKSNRPDILKGIRFKDEVHSQLAT